MQSWVNGLGNKRQDVLNRLSKESVRNHRNIRRGGEGGAPSNEYNYATAAGQQAQSDVEGYLSQVPLVSQATSLVGGVGNLIGGGRPGGRLNAMSQAENILSGGRGGHHHGHQHGGGGRRRSISPSGVASSYYAASRSDSTSFPEVRAPSPSSQVYGGSTQSSYAQPSYAQTSYTQTSYESSYAPPPSPPPPAPSHEGYHPSYEAPSGFPEPAWGEGPGGYGGGEGGYAPPSGPPPGFPSADADSYAPPPGPPPPGQGYDYNYGNNNNYWQ